MILAAGLTPAWQQILEFDSFQPGAVNRARSVHWCASGKVLNVGIALHALGASSRTLCVAGGETGRAMQMEFKSHGAQADWVSSDARTRVCTTILDRSSGLTTELVENAAPLSAPELDQFERTFRAECAHARMLILTGSLPLETPSDYYRRLLAGATCPAILDIRGPELLSVLDLDPFVVKPNRHELAATLERPIDSDDHLLVAMRELNDRGAQWAIVSNGPESVFATSRDAAFRLQPPRVKTVNPIGCGDCLTAGLAAALAAAKPMQDALRLGIAAAANNAEQLLPCRLDARRIAELQEAVRFDTV